MKPDGRNLPAIVLSIRNEEQEEQESAPHPKQRLWLKLQQEDGGDVPVCTGDLLRMHPGAEN